MAASLFRHLREITGAEVVQPLKQDGLTAFAAHHNLSYWLSLIVAHT